MPTTIRVTRMGDISDGALVDGDLADAALTQPVVSSQVRELLAAIEAGGSHVSPRRHAAASVSDQPDLSGALVLVADDSAVNREVVCEALLRMRARTVTVNNGAEAVEAYKRRHFDIVLMDCGMPVLDGFAATRAIRDFERRTGVDRTPVVALTAHVAGSGDSWRQAGMDDHLTKPFTMKSLGDCLRRWVRSAGAIVDGRSDAPVDGAGRDEGAGQGEAAAAADGSVAPSPPGPQRASTSSIEEKVDRAVPPAEPKRPQKAQPEAEPLDSDVLQALRDMASGSDALIGRVFALFLSHAPARLAALQDAASERDLAKTAVEAHALKSPSLNIGAKRLAARCAEIEARSRAGDATVLGDGSVDAVRREYQAVLAEIEGRNAGSQRPVLRAAG